jgi:succinoglycan biosynthesis protein ExoM
MNDLREDAGARAEPEGPEVSIVIPTFRRPRNLSRALESCLDQRTASGRAYEIVVVDNAPEGSAALVVAEVCRNAAVAIRYVHEPRPGISHARNAGLTFARGRFVAMLDDDERASAHWLWHLTRTQRDYQADVVFGPVLPEFEPVPEHDAAFLRRFHAYSTGKPTGARVGERSTNNALIRVARLAEGPAFDSRLGLIGGEDTLFFSQLRAKGARFIWCADAHVTETIPPERTTWPYVRWRAFRRGQCRAGTPMLLDPPRPARTVFWMGIGAIQLVGFGTIAAGLWLLRARATPQFTAKAIGGLGKLLWMRRFSRPSYGERAPAERGDFNPDSSLLANSAGSPQRPR